VFEIGEAVLVAVSAGDRPYVFVGRVAKLIGPYGAELADASMLPYAGIEATWPGLAAGDATMRAAMRVRRYAAPVRVGCNVSYVTPWAGELPTADQH